MDNSRIGEFIFFIVAWIFSLSLHEAAHAWMSYKFGDDLAYSQGRVTLNPLKHIDPVGSLLFPTLAFFMGAPLLGWATTPVNPSAWRNWRVANFWVSIAGIIANLLIAIVTGILIRILLASGAISFDENVTTFAQAAFHLLLTIFSLNVMLIILNLLPIPPLDGGSIIRSFLPESANNALAALDRFGFLLLYAAMFTGILGAIFGFFEPIAYKILLIGLRR
jgi:Zn-dependent protease